MCILSFIPFSLAESVPPSIESPEHFFGFIPGADTMLFDYGKLMLYLQKLDQDSGRVKLVEIGSTPLGKKMYILFISSEKNIENLEKLKEINRSLALDPSMNSDKRERMVDEGRVFVLATLSMHSTEVGPTQSLPIIAYELAVSNDPAILRSLDELVYMIVPCHNPDGMDMVVEHYNTNKGTKYEGSSLPGVYHKYVGHDNNRDFITLSQTDTKAIAAIYSREWFPQVMVEKHQMGSEGPRYFVPPPHDPISENIDAGIWNWVWVFGSNLAKDMTERGLEGISQHYLFDEYWPGSTETCLWKNVIGFLTEAASVKVATPIYVEPTELEASEKGLSEYKKSINMSLPWPGGWWKLSDIVMYEVESFFSILKTAAENRKEILAFRNDLCRREVERGKTEPPYYCIIPSQQYDMGETGALIDLLMEHGVEVFKLTATVSIGKEKAGNNVFHEGDVVIPLAQAFRPFIKEVMERQSFPVRHYTPGGQIIRPYDVTSWSLPLHRGVRSIEVTQRSDDLESKIRKIIGERVPQAEVPENSRAALFNVQNNESFKAAFMAKEAGLDVQRLEELLKVNQMEFPAGSFIILINERKRVQFEKILGKLSVMPVFLTETSSFPAKSMSMPRIALVESYLHDMDAGWTRFIFDSCHIPYTIVRPGDFETTDFIKSFDLVIFPDQDHSILKEGKRKKEDQYWITNFQPEHAKGIGDKGMEQLMSFIDSGGIIISWGRSMQLFFEALKIPRGDDTKEDFQLPIKDMTKQITEAGLYCPGSLLKVNVHKDHPLAFGMEEETGVFFKASVVFSTSLPRFDMDRRVIASFPEKDLLLSGYCEHEEKLGRKTAMAWFKKGKGQFVLLGFDPFFRASTQGTFKLVFNALLLEKIAK